MSKHDHMLCAKTCYNLCSLDALGAGDGEHVVALCVHPGQRQLPSRAALACCHLLDGIYQLQVLSGNERSQIHTYRDVVST